MSDRDRIVDVGPGFEEFPQSAVLSHSRVESPPFHAFAVSLALSAASEVPGIQEVYLVPSSKTITVYGEKPRGHMAQSWALAVIPIRNALGDCADKVQISNCVIEMMADGRSDQFSSNGSSSIIDQAQARPGSRARLSTTGLTGK